MKTNSQTALTFLLTALFVCIEMVLVAWFICHDRLTHYWLPLDSFAAALAALSLFICFINTENIQTRSKPKYIYIAINLCLAFILIGYLVYCISGYLFMIGGGVSKPLSSKTPFLIKFLLNEGIHSFYIIIFILLHFVLISVFFKIKDLISRYLTAWGIAQLLVLSLYIPLWQPIYRFLWGYMCFGLAREEFLLLKISGLNPILGYVKDKYPPIIGTHVFSISLYSPCSGIDGMVAFCIAFSVMIMINWGKIIDKKRIWIAGYIGIFTMHIVNVLRIYILILIGHFVSGKLAVHIWHTTGSLIFYCVAIITILSVAQEWLITKAVVLGKDS